MSKPGLSGQLAEEYCIKFPSAPSISIARMLCKDHPAVFLCVDTARDAVRRMRGKNGESNRAAMERTGRLVDRLDLPEPEPSDFKIYQLPPNIKRYLIVADSHIPFQDNRAILTMAKYAKDQRCDGLLILGDWFDLYQLSSWQRDPRVRDFVDELDTGEEIFLQIRDYLKPKEIVWKFSNHEYRLERYLMRRAPELFRLNQWCIEERLQLQKRGVMRVPHNCPIQHKELVLLHGDEWTGSSYSPVSPARRAMLKAAQCALVAHNHQPSEQPKMTALGVSLFAWSIGCLCNLHPEWMPLNEWHHGFAILHTEGKWRVENKRIVAGGIV